MKLFYRLAALTFALALISSPVAAQSGRLQGTVEDESGSALPGATLTITSPNLMGDRVTATDGDGNFAFTSLPPGTYTVSAALDSFPTQEVTDVPVRINRTAEVNFTMPSGSFDETLVVTGEAPILDPEQTSLTEVYTEEYLQNATVGSISRSYQSVLSQSAGATGGSNPNVLGATGGENAFFIDGFDTTDPVTSTFGVNLNFDIIQEIDFEKGGYSAEFGRAIGGVVNVVTKSGGNNFSGSLDYRFRDDGFATEGDFFDPDRNETEFQDLSATLGGPIAKDKLWFFASLETINSESTPFSAPATRDFEGTTTFAKLTLQANDSWSVRGRYIDEDVDIANANAGAAVAAAATRLQEQPTSIFGVDVLGLLTENIEWEIKFGQIGAELNSFPQSGDLQTHGHFTSAGARSVNYTNEQYSDRDRTEFGTSLTWFPDGLAGAHEFKFGFENAGLDFLTANNTVGDFRFQDSPLGTPFVYWFDERVSPAEFQGDLTTLYAQDTWRVNDKLTLNLGVRSDQVTYDRETGTEVADLDKIQPRLGAAYAFGADNRTVLSGHWGRYMHPNATTLPNFARQDGSASYRYISCSRFMPIFFGVDGSLCPLLGGPVNAGGRILEGHIFDPQSFDPNGWFLFDFFGAGAANMVDPNLEATYEDEILLSLKRQIGNNSSLSVTYIDAETEDIFEDTCNGNVNGFNASAACDFYVIANLDGLTRQYQGVLVEYEIATPKSRTKASVTFADSEGSVPYTQNTGIAFDIFPDHIQNRFGDLYDPDQAIRVNGYVNVPWGFIIGYDFSYDSEFTYESRDDAPSYGEIFLEPRGSRDADEFYRLDLNVAKRFEIGEVGLQLIGSIYNALDDEHMLSICDNINGCGSVPFEGGLTFRQPRNYELGVRIQF